MPRSRTEAFRVCSNVCAVANVWQMPYETPVILCAKCVFGYLFCVRPCVGNRDEATKRPSSLSRRFGVVGDGVQHAKIATRRRKAGLAAFRLNYGRVARFKESPEDGRLVVVVVVAAGGGGGGAGCALVAVFTFAAQGVGHAGSGCVSPPPRGALSSLRAPGDRPDVCRRFSYIALFCVCVRVRCPWGRRARATRCRRVARRACGIKRKYHSKRWITRLVCR